MSARDREWAENKEEAIWSGLKDKNLDILTDVYRVLEKVKVKMITKNTNFNFIENNIIKTKKMN